MKKDKPWCHVLLLEHYAWEPLTLAKIEPVHNLNGNMDGLPSLLEFNPHFVHAINYAFAALLKNLSKVNFSE